MGSFFLGLGLMLALWGVFVAAVVMTELHDRRPTPPIDEWAPPLTHVRQIPR